MIYLDNAATTHKKPRCVADTLYRLTKHMSANAGRGSNSFSVRAGEIIYDAQEALASLFHVKNPERIIFTQNTTQALNFAIHGFLRKEDSVVITSMEHNSVLRPVFYSGCRCNVVFADKDGFVSTDKMEKAIDDGTKLVIINHVSNVTGSRQDIEKICEIAKKKGAAVLVDAAQSGGVFDIDAEKTGIDMLAFAGHKALMGPLGTGGLYVREGIELYPILQGGGGTDSENPYQSEAMPDRLTSGTQNMPAIGALASGVRFVSKIGIDSIRNHEKKLAGYFYDEMTKRKNITVYGKRPECGVVSINVKNYNCIEAARILNDEYKIAVRAGLHCAPLAHKTIQSGAGTVRLSFGYFNTAGDAERAADAIKKLAKNE